MENTEPTCIGHREQPVIFVPVNKKVQNSSGPIAYDHGPEKRRPTVPKERFYMRVFVGEDGPTDCTCEYCDDNHDEDKRRLKEVDVKV